jgi:outer membrane protein assembly factor BamB
MDDPTMRDTHDVHPTSRRMRFARPVALVAVLALTGCSGLAGLVGDDEDQSKPTKLESFEPATKVKSLWSRRASSGEGGLDLELRAVLAGGQVFAAGHDGDVAAFDPFTGKPLWEAETGISISGGPGAGPGLVVVGGSGGDIVALSSTDGAVAWRARVTSEVLSAPAVGERIVAVRTVDGKLFGLDTTNGERSWVYDRTVPVLTLRGTSAPVIAGDIVVAGFDSGHLAAVSLADGRLLWESHVAAPTGRTELERLADIDADPVVSDGVVYVVTFQGRIAAFDLDTGRPLWQRDMSSHAGIGIGRRLLYVTDEQSHVWALDRGSGSSLWRQDGLELRHVTRPVEFAEYAVVADFEGHVHWLSIDDGRFAARIRAGGSGVLAPPVATEAAVYVLGESGTLTALTLP